MTEQELPEGKGLSLLLEGSCELRWEGASCKPANSSGSAYMMPHALCSTEALGTQPWKKAPGLVPIGKAKEPELPRSRLASAGPPLPP